MNQLQKKIAEIVSDAPDDFNTLKELSDINHIENALGSLETS